MGNEIKIIEDAFANIENINPDSNLDIINAINTIIENLDNGSLRIANSE